MKFIEKLKFNDDGLIPAIVQEESTARVVMMAWMNEASLKLTIETGRGRRDGANCRRGNNCRRYCRDN